MPIWFDTRDFSTGLHRLKLALNANTWEAWRDTSKSAADWMRGNGYKDRTGALSKSMTATPVLWDWCNFQATIAANANYALWVDQATMPHMIEAKVGRWEGRQRPGQAPGQLWVNKAKQGKTGAKMLRWYVGGQPVFARRVMHPGTSGARFTNRMAAIFEDIYPQSLQAAVDRSVANG